MMTAQEYVSNKYFNLKKTYRNNNQEIPYTLDEFKEHVDKNTKFNFMYEHIKEDDPSTIPKIKLGLGDKLQNMAIYTIPKSGYKKCTKCGDVLELNRFGVAAGKPMGREARCLRCVYSMSFIKHNKLLLDKHGMVDCIKHINEKTDYLDRYNQWDKEDPMSKPILKYKNKDKSSLENIYVTSKEELKNKDSKRCVVCGEVKPVSEFYKNKYVLDGYDNKCKSCDYERKHSKDGLILSIYNRQKHKSVERGHTLPTYTVKEFKNWMYNNLILIRCMNNGSTQNMKK
jgi:hypothetical protein